MSTDGSGIETNAPSRSLFVWHMKVGQDGKLIVRPMDGRMNT